MIIDILTAPGMGAFFYDDQQAIRAGALQEGFIYNGTPQTPGFSSIRMPARSLSVGLVLADGAILWGDMLTVQYSGIAGREPVFNITEAKKIIEELKPRLLQIHFKDIRHDLKMLFLPLKNEQHVPLSIQYGISQAILSAYAHLLRLTMTEVLVHAYSLPMILRPVPIYAQSGDDRYNQTQKMILKRVEILPHGLFNSPAKLGTKGEKLLEFVQWITQQIAQAGDANYYPALHFDVYGTIGLEFGLDAESIASYIEQLAKAAAPFQLHIESPADYGSSEAQINGYIKIRQALKNRGCSAKIVADEWCDTLEDIRQFAQQGAADIIQIKLPDAGCLLNSMDAAILCKQHGIGVYIGGSCTETDLSARASVHVAVATQADMQLAKPGMGVDEALSITGNEQSRLMAILKTKYPLLT
ncbi:MAG: methylaspartate ammonia-lyase [Pseudomonadota bacterium]